MYKFLLATLTALCLAVPLAAQAQDLPSYANPNPALYSADQNIHGRVVGFDGGYNLTVRDERGYLDNVRLHQGTIINPTGLTLAPGMVVSVLGYNGGSFFSANEIDTPYAFYSGVPYYAGHPWNYYGPSISLGFFFGSAGWWHGGYFHGGYHYAGGARVYNNVHVNTIYRGGYYRGHDFVARPEHGGYYGRPHGDFHGRDGGHDEGHRH